MSLYRRPDRPSVLRPETRAVLYGVRGAGAALFHSAQAAETFEAAHTVGRLTLLPTTAGGYVVFDRGAPFAQGIVEGPIADLEAAHAALERHVADRLARPQAGQRLRAA